MGNGEARIRDQVCYTPNTKVFILKIQKLYIYDVNFFFCLDIKLQENVKIKEKETKQRKRAQGSSMIAQCQVNVTKLKI